MLICVAAVLKLGAIAGMLNHQQRGDALTHSIKLTKAALVIVGEECREAIDSTPYAAGGSLPIQRLWDGAADAPEGYVALRPLLADASSSNPPETAQITLKSPAFYIFTSGTTGLPKASVMSHFRWLRGMSGLADSAVRLHPDDVLYCCLPLYHNNALTVSLGVVLASGACFALDEKFSASQFWRRISHYRATAFCYIGELLRYLLNQAPHMDDQNHEIRLILGNGLRPEIWDDFENRFGIHQIFEFYGASESNLGFMNAFGLKETVGFCPMPFEVIACDADSEQVVRNSHGFCETVGRGEVGLLISEVTELRPFDGYTDPKANEGKLLRNVFKRGDCWFNSGDLVRRQGWQHIQFVDRLGDTFRWKGENVATSEVEGVLAKLPFLEHAVVYGVKLEGFDGRAGMAAVAVKPGAKLDLKALAAHVTSHLPSYAVPMYVRVLQAVETTGTFKYQKTQLKKRALTEMLSTILCTVSMPQPEVMLP